VTKLIFDYSLALQRQKQLHCAICWRYALNACFPIIFLKHFSCQARCMVLAEEWSCSGDRLVDHHTLSGGLPKQQLNTERRWLHEIS